MRHRRGARPVEGTVEGGPHQMFCRPRRQGIGHLRRAGGPPDGDLVAGMARDMHQRRSHLLGRVEQRTGIDCPARNIGAMHEARGVDHSWEHTADMDVGMASHLLAQARGETAQAELARRVGGGEGRRRPAAEGNHINEDAAVPVEEAGQGGVGPVQGSEQVHLDGASVQVERRVLERAEYAGAGIVDPDIDPAEALLRRPRQSLDRLRIGDIGWHRQGRRSEPGAFLGQPFERFPAPGCRHDMGAGAGEGEGGGAADAARRAGDDDDGSVQGLHSDLPIKAPALEGRTHPFGLPENQMIGLPPVTATVAPET